MKTLPDSGGVFSISGGGDPLNNYEKFSNFWTLIDFICTTRGLKYDIHTSINPRQFDLKKNLNKIVLHIFPDRNWDQLKELLIKGYRLRTALVIDRNVTLRHMETLENFHWQFEITYRELCGSPDQSPKPEVLEFAKRVAERRHGGKFVYNGDYNTYLFPDGSIRTKFLDS